MDCRNRGGGTSAEFRYGPRSIYLPLRPPDFFGIGSPKGDTERTVAAIFIAKLGAYPPLEGAGGGKPRSISK